VRQNLQDTDADGAKSSKEAEAAAERLRGKIRDEVKSLGEHAWAGEYYYGDGLGVNVAFMLAPRAGYVFEWHGCLGLYDRNYGKVSYSNGAIHLQFTYPNQRRGFGGIAPELVPVSWGERTYLIPADDVVGFCNEVNSGSEPRGYVHGNCLLRSGDEEKVVGGFPDVPQPFRNYLLKMPIEAKIVAVGSPTTRPSVGGGKFRENTVTVDKGRQAGLLAGMKLYVFKPFSVVNWIDVTDVRENEAQGTMTRVLEDEPGPEVGWELSTRSRWAGDGY